MYEYTQVTVLKSQIRQEDLAKLGKDGWELCCAVSTTEPASDATSLWPAYTTFYFKRRV